MFCDLVLPSGDWGRGDGRRVASTRSIPGWVLAGVGMRVRSGAAAGLSKTQGERRLCGAAGVTLHVRYSAIPASRTPHGHWCCRISGRASRVSRRPSRLTFRGRERGARVVYAGDGIGDVGGLEMALKGIPGVAWGSVWLPKGDACSTAVMVPSSRRGV